MSSIVKGWVMSVPLVFFYLKDGIVLYSLLCNSFKKNPATVWYRKVENTVRTFWKGLGEQAESSCGSAALFSFRLCSKDLQQYLLMQGIEFTLGLSPFKMCIGLNFDVYL